MSGKGLYANIHAKRKRGEKMRKKGAKGAPTDKDFKNAEILHKRGLYVGLHNQVKESQIIKLVDFLNTI